MLSSRLGDYWQRWTSSKDTRIRIVYRIEDSIPGERHGMRSSREFHARQFLAIVIEMEDVREERGIVHRDVAGNPVLHEELRTALRGDYRWHGGGLRLLNHVAIRVGLRRKHEHVHARVGSSEILSM